MNKADEKKKSNFEMTVLYKVKRHIIPNRNGEKIGEDRIYVVKYSRGEPRLEKRNYFMKDDELTMGKMKGFTQEDLDIIQSKMDKIKRALAGEQVSKNK